MDDKDKKIKELEEQIERLTKAKSAYISLTEIWNDYKRPFIVQNEEGYFVLIEKDINQMKEKYNGHIYGKADKNISALLKPYKKSHEIQDMDFWHIVKIY